MAHLVLTVNTNINVYVTVLIMKFDLFVRLSSFRKKYFRSLVPLILIFLGLTTNQTSSLLTTTTTTSVISSTSTTSTPTTSIITNTSTSTITLTSTIPSNCNNSIYILLFNGTCALKTDVQV